MTLLGAASALREIDGLAGLAQDAATVSGIGSAWRGRHWPMMSSTLRGRSVGSCLQRKSSGSQLSGSILKNTEIDVDSRTMFDTVLSWTCSGSASKTRRPHRRPRARRSTRPVQELVGHLAEPRPAERLARRRLPIHHPVARREVEVHAVRGEAVHDGGRALEPCRRSMPDAPRWKVSSRASRRSGPGRNRRERGGHCRGRAAVHADPGTAGARQVPRARTPAARAIPIPTSTSGCAWVDDLGRERFDLALDKTTGALFRQAWDAARRRGREGARRSRSRAAPSAQRERDRGSARDDGARCWRTKRSQSRGGEKFRVQIVADLEALAEAMGIELDLHRPVKLGAECFLPATGQRLSRAAAGPCATPACSPDHHRVAALAGQRGTHRDSPPASCAAVPKRRSRRLRVPGPHPVALR